MYVSHRLNEVVALTDRVVVMQDGRVTLERETHKLTERSLIDAIAGSAALADRVALPPLQQQAGPPLLAVKALSRPPAVADISFELHPGEILGLAGLVGSGRTETARMICGADKPSSGSIEVDGRTVRFRDPVDAIHRGIALLPEDRRHEGLVLNFGVRENITLTSLESHRLARLLPFPDARASARLPRASRRASTSRPPGSSARYGDSPEATNRRSCSPSGYIEAAGC